MNENENEIQILCDDGLQAEAQDRADEGFDYRYEYSTVDLARTAWLHEFLKEIHLMQRESATEMFNKHWEELYFNTYGLSGEEKKKMYDEDKERELIMEFEEELTLHIATARCDEARGYGQIQALQILKMELSMSSAGRQVELPEHIERVFMFRHALARGFWVVLERLTPYRKESTQILWSYKDQLIHDHSRLAEEQGLAEQDPDYTRASLLGDDLRQIGRYIRIIEKLEKIAGELAVYTA